MCGRFSLTDHYCNVRWVQTKWGFPIREEIDDWPESYNIAPSQPHIILKDNSIVPAQFGFIPSWSKDPKKYFINARVETVTEKPSFRNAFRDRRCLIPADGFFEWKKEEGSKTPYYFQLLSSEPFCFAGIYNDWNGEIMSFAILTQAANDFMGSFHGRMPVILTKDNYADYLEGGKIPEPPELFAVEVSKAVNNPRNNSPAILQKV